MGFNDGDKRRHGSVFIIFILDHLLIAVDLSFFMTIFVVAVDVHLRVFFGTILGIVELLVVFVHVCISVSITDNILVASCWCLCRRRHSCELSGGR
jgi:hypothetical protein